MSRNFARLAKHERERARDEKKAAKAERRAERQAAKVFASYAGHDSALDATTGMAEAEATQ